MFLNYVFVTSFNGDGYRTYGKQFIEGFIKHFPKEAHLVVFYEEVPDCDFDDPRVCFINLRKDKDLQKFLTKYKDVPEANGVVGDQINYRYQAVKFAHKVAAITSPSIPSSNWRIWIDADVVIKKDIPLEFFSENFPPDDTLFHYIGRDPEIWNHCEAGFVAYQTSIPATLQLLEMFRNLYFGEDHEVFKMSEWHDSYVLDQLRIAGEENGFQFNDIADGIKEMHPWPHTILGEYMDHAKGPVAKQQTFGAVDVKPTPQAPMHGAITKELYDSLSQYPSRYNQINALIHHTQPQTIVEVGTFNGDRAINMLEQAIVSHGKPVHYIGFDIFEDKDEEFNKREYNGKQTDLTYTEIEQKIQEYADTKDGLVTFELVRGNTLETLPAYEWDREIDFVWLDGGHAVETIASDYNALVKANPKLILFDDFYHDGVDTNRYGCNQVVRQLNHLPLPIIDHFGKQQISIVAAGPIALQKDLPIVKANKNLQLKTRNCVPDEVIQENVRYSAQFRNQVVNLPIVSRPVKDKLLFLGGSDSINNPEHSDYKKNWKKIKDCIRRGYKTVAVKTSYDHVVERGVIPDYCVLLDPRDHVHSSFKTIPSKDTVFVISSMCDHHVWDMFVKGGYNVVAYHAAVNAGEEKIIQQEWTGVPIAVISGGTTSGFRGIRVFYHAGFRNFTLAGFDSSYEKVPDKTHGRSPKEPIVVKVMDRKFITDPELMAQSNDLEQMLKAHPNIKFSFIGNGMIQFMGNAFNHHIATTPEDVSCIEPTLDLYKQTLPLQCAEIEALAIDGAYESLKKRREFVQSRVNRLPTFEDLINKS